MQDRINHIKETITFMQTNWAHSNIYNFFKKLKSKL
jgi:hypothetical protein